MTVDELALYLNSCINCQREIPAPSDFARFYLVLEDEEGGAVNRQNRIGEFCKDCASQWTAVNRGVAP